MAARRILKASLEQLFQLEEGNELIYAGWVWGQTRCLDCKGTGNKSPLEPCTKCWDGKIRRKIRPAT